MSELPPVQSFEEFEAETVPLITPPFRSTFGAVTWAETWQQAKEYQWLIKGILPAREAVLIYGAPQTGKSFETQNMALHIARGVDFYGRRTRKAGVVYCAFEGGKGFLNRQKAYAIHHTIARDEPLDMVVLTRRADLFSNDDDINALMIEIRHWASRFTEPLGLIVLDTWSAATPGANENASEDVSRVRARVMRLVDEFRCCVIVVHHKPAAGGRPRGHGSLTGDFETTIDIDWLTTIESRKEEPIKDADNRPIRQAKITKQREGEQGLTWRFVLRQVETGRDADNDPITSCVSLPPAGGVDDAKAAEKPRERMSPDGRWYLKTNVETSMMALNRAIERAGRLPPDTVRSPAGQRCVTLSDWRDEWERIAQGEEESPDALKERVKKARDRAIEKILLPQGFIGKDGEWVWRTSKRVFNVDPELRRRERQPIDDLPGDIDDTSFPF